jgi:hypothetical protein
LDDVPIILLAIEQCQYLRDYILVTTSDSKDPPGDPRDDQEEENKREAEIQSDKPPHHG